MYKQKSTTAIKVRVALVGLILLIWSFAAMAQHRISSTGKYVLGDSVNRPLRVIIHFDKLSQFGWLYRDSLYFQRYNKLVPVRKSVKGWEVVSGNK